MSTQERPERGQAEISSVEVAGGAAPSEVDSNPLDRRVLLLGAGLAGVAALGGLARRVKAGPIDPPAGPVSSTGLTLAQLDTKMSSSTGQIQSDLQKIDHKVAFSPVGVSEPRTPITACPSSSDAQFVVTEPGAYYLPGNIQQDPAKPVCIDVQTDDFDLDGQGFNFVGGGGALSSCIRAVQKRNIEVYDCGFIRWRGCPCDLESCDDVFISDCVFRSCTCPDSTTGTPGAMIRARDHVEVSDTAMVSCGGAAAVLRDCAYLFELTVTSSSSTGSMIRCAGNSCISTCAVLMCSSAGGAMYECQSDCTITECSMRQCTCHTGFHVSSRCVVEGVECSGGTGGFCQCADSCSFEDCVVSSRSLAAGSPVQAMIVGGDRCSVTEVDFRSCDGFAVLLGGGSVVECCECTGGWGAFCDLGPSSSVEDCTISGRSLSSSGGGGGGSGGMIRCADGSCVSECDVRNCVGQAVSVAHNCVVECCEVSGGSGGAFLCLDGCCVEDSSVTNHEGFAAQCGASCSIDDNHFRQCWGATCGAMCCVSDNEMSVSSSALGGGAAITVSGQRCCVSGNFITNGSIVVIVGGDFSLLERNHLTGSGGPPGTGAGSISIASGVSNCHVRSNHVRHASTTSAFSLPPTTSFGTIVNATAGGDVSFIRGGGDAHSNFVY